MESHSNGLRCHQCIVAPLKQVMTELNCVRIQRAQRHSDHRGDMEYSTLETLIDGLVFSQLPRAAFGCSPDSS